MRIGFAFFLIQRKIIEYWHKTEQLNATNGPFPQVKKNAEQQRPNINTCIIECIKRWIYYLKEIKQRSKNKKIGYQIILSCF